MDIVLHAIVHPIDFIRWMRTMKLKLFLFWLITPVWCLTFWICANLGSQRGSAYYHSLRALLGVDVSLALLVETVWMPFMLFFVGYNGRDDKYITQKAQREAQKLSHAQPQ